MILNYYLIELFLINLQYYIPLGVYDFIQLTKINKFNTATVGDENIMSFDVTMNDVVFVKKF